jgi:carbon monoxide dehydrogenase subunit G
MGIPIEKSFVVQAPAAAVWEFLIDPYRVASCLPGAAITEKLDDSSYAGTITIKVGPVTASYRGKMRFERLDAAAREAELSASGQEVRGKGGADMRMKSRIAEHGAGESEVTVVSDVNVMGVLAQFGRGMIQDVSDQMFQRFTDGMRRQLAAAAPDGAAAAGGAAAGGAAAPATEAAPGTAAAVGAAAAAGAASGPAAATAAATAGIVTAAGTAAATGAGTGGFAAIDPASVAPPAPPGAASLEALDVGAIGAVALRRAAGRALRRPGFWIAVAVVAALVAWFWLR